MVFQTTRKNQTHVMSVTMSHYTVSLLLYVTAVAPNRHGYVLVDKGDAVKFPCHVKPTAATNVTWLQTTLESFVHKIYINGTFHSRLRQRASIQDAATGDYTLTILNMQPVNSGQYQCYDQQKLLKTYNVSVTGK